MKFCRFNTVASALGNKHIFLIGCLVSILGRGQVLFQPLYSMDGYMYAYHFTLLYTLFLQQGRYGLAILTWMREMLGYYGPDVAVSALIFSVLLFFGGALLLARSIFSSTRQSAVLIFVVMVLVHPFGTEFFYFSEATLGVAIAFFLGSAGTYLAIKGTRFSLHTAAATSLLVLALSIYQSIICCAAASCLMAILSQLLYSDDGTIKNAECRPQIRALGVCIASVFVYIFSLKIVAVVVRVPVDGRMDFSAFISWPQAQAKVLVLANAFELFFWPMPGLVSPTGSSLFLLLLSASIALILYRLLSAGRLIQAALAVVLTAASMIAALLPQFAGQVVWPVPRALWPAIIPAAAILALGWSLMPPKPRPVGALLLMLLALVFIAGSNHILSDERRINRWDMNQANRIVARLELEKDFRQATTIVIIGGDWRRTTALQTAIGDMNVAVFSVPANGVRLGLIQEATGYHFALPTPAQKSAAAEYCRSAGTWPSSDSVALIGPMAVACLPPPA
jgi:hypothetical protein